MPASVDAVPSPVANGDATGAGGATWTLPGYPAINCVIPEPNACAASID